MCAERLQSFITQSPKPDFASVCTTCEDRVFYFMIMEKEAPNYYAVLTSEVRYDNRLSSSEKLFFAEITALSNKTGECWASNSYFAKLYDVSNSTVSGWVKKLCSLGYVDVSYQYDGKQITRRYISIKASGVHLFEGGYSENRMGGIQKTEGGYSENLKENTTSINITRKNNSVYDFEQFWDDYGKKRDKAKCEQKWKRLPEKDKLAIKEFLPVYVKASPDAQYRKNPLTFLNAKTWHDDLSEYKKEEEQQHQPSYHKFL